MLAIPYPDPLRTPERYAALHGGDGSLASFITAVRAQSRYAWRNEFTAAAINTWIRQGFGRETDAVRMPRVASFPRMKKHTGTAVGFTPAGRQIRQPLRGTCVLLIKDENGVLHKVVHVKR